MYYTKLKELSLKVPSLDEKQIKADLKRTNPKRSEDNEFLSKLKNILICFSIRNSSIGYCQGYNFLASRIIEVIIDEVKFSF